MARASLALTASESGFLAADTAGITLTATRAAGENVGPYVITPLATGGNVANYAITYVNGTFTITAKPATVTAADGTKVYGASDPTLTASQSGFLAGDTAGITLTATRAAGENVGPYVITPLATGGNVANYAITYVNGTFTITAKPATVTAANGTKVYGASDPTLTASESGFLAGDTAGITLTATRAAGENVGPYVITPLATGGNVANYAITYVNGTFTITAKPATVTAADATKVYGAGDPPLTASESGFLAGDTAGITLTATRAAGENVGPYVITPLATGGNVANYAITYVNGTFTITAKPATVTAADGTKVYGAGDPGLTASENGFLAGDTAGITLTATRAAGENVGPYVITPLATGGNVGNYAITYVNGTFTITAKPATVTAADATKVYGAGDPRLTASESGFLAGDTAGITLTATRAAGENVGALCHHALGERRQRGQLRHHLRQRDLHHHGQAGDGDRGRCDEGVWRGRPGIDGE